MDKRGIYVNISADKIEIYVHSIKAACGSYMCYSLQHFITPYTDGGTYQNQDLWRLFKLYDYMQDNEEMIFRKSFDFELVNGGEWECAIKISNTPDFHGGLHGYERQKSYYAQINGKTVNLTDETATWTNEFVFVQNSEIYRQGTKNEVIAYHQKQYTFTAEGLEIHQEIKWTLGLSVELAYVTMLPIRRTSDDTENGVPITDKVTFNYVPMIYDVSKEGHNAREAKKDVTQAKIWSDCSGITAELGIRCKSKSSNAFFVQNTKEYNKLYYCYVGYGEPYNTQLGEKWEINSNYDIYRKNIDDEHCDIYKKK